jgi:hypothetical protein
MHVVMRAAAISLLPIMNGCVSISTPGAGGVLTGKLIVQWAGENKFIYLPDPDDPLVFVSTDKKRIVPQRMYTDGGSVPPIFWSVPGFSPWGYGPAYIIHDWLFEQHHCRYEGWTEISFEDSARILGETIDTLVARGDVAPNPVARQLIEQGVRTGLARQRWSAANDCSSPPAQAPGSPGGRSRMAPTGPIILRLDFSSPRRI